MSLWDGKYDQHRVAFWPVNVGHICTWIVWERAWFQEKVHGSSSRPSGNVRKPLGRGMKEYNKSWWNPRPFGGA